jgi:catechol 2,3-dioxygenase-like lactoylglutathione lyase family enzyme
MEPGFTLQSAGLARLSHVSVSVPDLDATVQWWTTHFGYQPMMRLDLSGPEFEAVTGVEGAVSRAVRGVVAPGTILQLFWHNWRPAETPNVLLSFEVRDAALAYAALTAGRVVCQSPPVEFENSWAFTAADLNGLPIEIIQWKPHVEPYTLR